MDYIRASVKALFYDYPVDSAIDAVITGSPLPTSLFPRLVNLRDTTLTQAKSEALRKRLCNDWLNRRPSLSADDEMVKLLCLPYLYAKDVLEYKENGNVTVKFDWLFRWTALIRYVGEDLLTISYLAKNDVDTGLARKDFVWKNVLPHNNFSVNSILNGCDKGLCDIHLHFGASTDVFQISWVSLMNDLMSKKKVFDSLKYPLDSPVVVTRNYNYDNLYRWCILAGLIRWELYKYYVIKEESAFKKGFEVSFNKMARQDSMCYSRDIKDFQCLLTEEGKKSLKTSDGIILDYAIVDNVVDTEIKGSPFMIYYGERYLLYQFYRDYWRGAERVRTIGKYVYLYELIKNQLRRELVQVNHLIGLGNFQEYNKRKTKLVPNELDLASKQFAVQSSIENNLDGMEVRITPQETVEDYNRLAKAAYYKHIFGAGEFTTENSLNERLTFVVHFLKSKCEKNNRYSEMRKNLRQQAGVLMKDVIGEEKRRGIRHRIVGIDAAGGETNTRPEVFAHLYRYCKRCGMKNFTYHVGEDFYDLTEGLRSIEEAVRFLQIGEGNRLGHCLALGMDAKRYYEERHGVVIMPRQVLLDNMVWLLKQAELFCLCVPHEIKEYLNSEIIRLYELIEYKSSFNMDSYYRSMLLRGDDFEKYEKCCSDWNVTTFDDSQQAIDARKDEGACILRDAYFNDKSVYEKGFLQTEEFKIPYRYEKLIKKLQDRMIKWIKTKNICIETNPTSNVRIGGLGKYEDLPLFRLAGISKRPNRRVMVSVNTDDKGIFATSLYRELALLSLALKKQRFNGSARRWSDKEIYNYVKCLAEAGQKHRFKA